MVLEAVDRALLWVLCWGLCLVRRRAVTKALEEEELRWALSMTWALKAVVEAEVVRRRALLSKALSLKADKRMLEEEEAMLEEEAESKAFVQRACANIDALAVVMVSMS